MTNVSFESSLEQLQKAVKKLEGGELSLEDSLRQFEEGVRLTRVCQEYLSTAEQRVELLMKASEGQVEVQPFPSGRA
ncbi:MAG: exodeoxyribonuclease VII small subunit [Bdellovibrionia bacterium]